MDNYKSRINEESFLTHNSKRKKSDKQIKFVVECSPNKVEE